MEYAGPVTLKTWSGRGAKTYKGGLAVFICPSTSACHLEVVSDYFSEKFIAAYRRLISRRGICQSLYSDCGAMFQGADLFQKIIHFSHSRTHRTKSDTT